LSNNEEKPELLFLAMNNTSNVNFYNEIFVKINQFHPRLTCTSK
jgi:hypothetical protein